MSPHLDVALLAPAIADTWKAALRTITLVESDQAEDAAPSLWSTAVDRALSGDSMALLEQSRQSHDGE